MPGRIFFRGDNRHPTQGARIFTNGFRCRNDSHWYNRLGYALVIGGPRYRGGGHGVAGDLDPPTAVCVSARSSAAAYFPLKFSDDDPREDTFLYMVYVEIDDIFNTHGQQVATSLGGVASGLTASRAMWPLFAHELATRRIDAANIIAAVECRRDWSGPTWQQGGTYELGTSLLQNPNCLVASNYRTPGMQFLLGEIQNNRRARLPQGDSGYVRSTRT
jgi:hypothetical protein